MGFVRTVVQTGFSSPWRKGPGINPRDMVLVISKETSGGRGWHFAFLGGAWRNSGIVRPEWLQR